MISQLSRLGTVTVCNSSLAFRLPLGLCDDLTSLYCISNMLLRLVIPVVGTYKFP